MAICYNIVFSPDEATHWIILRDDKIPGIIPGKAYEIKREMKDNQKACFIVNEAGEKLNEEWMNSKGDYITFT